MKKMSQVPEFELATSSAPLNSPKGAEQIFMTFIASAVIKVWTRNLSLAVYLT